MQEHGDWPRALVIDLWGSASLRTGGEEIAQGLALMGCRPQWDAATGRVTGIEVLPPAAVGRPRVDVTWRISGLFRDMFPAQIALIDAAVGGGGGARGDAGGEPAAAAAGPRPRADLRLGARHLRRRHRGAAGERRLGGARGDRPGLSRRRRPSPSAAPTARARQRRGAFAERVAAAELLVHTGDDPGRDMLEGSADVAFVGGFAAAVAALGGKADLVDARHHRSGAAAGALAARGGGAGRAGARATTRASSPAQMRHGPRGAAEFAETVDRLVGFAETTDAVPGALIEAVHDAYVGDPEVRAFLLRENPAAARRHRRALRRGAAARPLASAAQRRRRGSRGADRRGAGAGGRGMTAVRRGACPALAAPMPTGRRLAGAASRWRAGLDAGAARRGLAAAARAATATGSSRSRRAAACRCAG